MSENKHTPEPWGDGEDNDGWYVEKDGLQIAHGLIEEDARRIVACVNACAGMDDPQSELDQLRQRVAELEALSVTRIMLSVSPGEDGNGQEIYAKSVDDVVEVLTKIDTENERLEAENARLKTQLAEAIRHESENLTLLVASQLREKQLRDALEYLRETGDSPVDSDNRYVCIDSALALPADDSALREYVAGKMKPMVEALENVIQATHSHIDGRDLLAELHPRHMMDIKVRRDGEDLWFEADWLSNLQIEINKAKPALEAARKEL